MMNVNRIPRQSLLLRSWRVPNAQIHTGVSRLMLSPVNKKCLGKCMVGGLIIQSPSSISIARNTLGIRSFSLGWWKGKTEQPATTEIPQFNSNIKPESELISDPISNTPNTPAGLELQHDAINSTSAVSEPLSSATDTTTSMSASASNIDAVSDVTFSTSDSVQQLASEVTNQLSSSSDIIPYVAYQLGDLKAAGVMHNTPPGAIEWILEQVYINTGLPWWGTIAVTAIGIRLMFFPLLIKILANTARLSVIQPQISASLQRTKEASARGDTQQVTYETKKIQKLFKEHNCHPFKSLGMPLVQIPIFLSFFFAVRNIAGANIPSFAHEGLFWFTNLSAADPMHILPVVSAGIILLNLELGSDTGANVDPRFKIAARLMTLIAIPCTWSFESGLFVYWLASGIFSLIQGIFLRNKSVRKYYGLPEQIAAPVDPNAPKPPGFWESLKNSYEGARRMAMNEQAKPVKSSPTQSFKEIALLNYQKEKEKAVQDLIRNNEPAPTVASTVRPIFEDPSPTQLEKPPTRRRREKKKN